MKTFIVSLCLVLITATPALAETAYKHVMDTKELRCAYFIEYPLTIKNPNTGKIEGIVPDIAELLALMDREKH